MNSGDELHLSIVESILSITSRFEIVGLRPSSYNVLNKDEADELKKEYPDGVKCVC